MNNLHITLNNIEWAAYLRLFAKVGQPFIFENEEKAIEIHKKLDKNFKRDGKIIYRRTVSK
jgi:hypothetical protein